MQPRLIDRGADGVVLGAWKEDNDPYDEVIDLLDLLELDDYTHLDATEDEAMTTTDGIIDSVCAGDPVGLLAWADQLEEAGDIEAASVVRLVPEIPRLIAVPSTNPLRRLCFSADGKEHGYPHTFRWADYVRQQGHSPVETCRALFDFWDVLRPLFEHVVNRLGLSVIDIGFTAGFERSVQVYLRRNRHVEPKAVYEQAANALGWLNGGVVAVRLRRPR
jgi:hypothetical protein